MLVKCNQDLVERSYSFQFHELLQKKIKEVDDVLASMKKSLGVK